MAGKNALSGAKSKFVLGAVGALPTGRPVSSSIAKVWIMAGPRTVVAGSDKESGEETCAHGELATPPL